VFTTGLYFQPTQVTVLNCELKFSNALGPVHIARHVVC